ncbi:peptide/nickel transport system permease protein [Deinobacterium chartae]|uniref:Peptide/nickel transport system permease protein n=1 Tax=Deinobacterium chartae TaxID=521158 RepID=A0A841I476_9DEIO|nr:ABC transporter permease [Deinobacterium chartae]MBB6100133.1 peptide/nickel transport system permease protein [Deinobacterium chartae]
MTRLTRGTLTLASVVILAFVLGRASGDPVALMLPDTATPEQISQMRSSLGLDGPLTTQLARYISNLLHGDLGSSLIYNRPALEVVLERLPASLVLTVPAFVIAVLLGVLLGVTTAVRRGSLLDHAVRFLTLMGQSLPSFFIGIALILLFGVTLRLLPTFGNDSLAHALLPGITLAIAPLALVTRLVRSSVLEVLHSDYVRTAHAKGLPRTTVLVRHALRNSLIPLVSLLGLEIPSLIGGALVIETVFAWPGTGFLAVQAIGGRDFPVIQTIVLLSSLAYVAASLMVDALYAWLDPRVGEEKA